MKIREFIKMYFIDEINLGRFVTTKEMIRKGLEVNMRDEDFNKMSPAAFEVREGTEYSAKTNKKDRVVTIWSEPKRMSEAVTLEDFSV